MKRVISCVLLMLVLTSNAFALEVPTDTVVQNLNGSQQAIKTFTVSPEQDPAALIEEPFELEGYLYTFADIVKSENPVEEKRIHTEVITVETTKDDLALILEQLKPTIEYDDGRFQGNLQYMERLPIKKKGVTMHLGERFCVAGKRARKFKRSDPKTYVPSWCPRLKAPCELRIYGLKNQREWRMHRSMCAYLGEDTSPSAFRYAVRYEGHTDLAPYEFFECCNEKSDDEILGAAVQHYDVVEIDDGIKPAFFYKTEHGYELLFSFDAKTAKKNIREEID